MEQLTCWVCCKELDFHALGACGHNDMCLYCACRLRILLKDYKCPICKMSLPQVLITKNPNAKLEDYPELDVCKNGHGILCDSAEAQEAYSKIQSFDCWIGNCKYPKNKTMAQLIKHMDSHKLRFCKTCLKGRLIFIWEQKLYTQQELTRHLNFGDDDIPRHRECLFCKSVHYDENELRNHLESRHCFCNICESKSYLYYENYEKLKQHYQKSHYMCHDLTCAESKYSVFKTPYELQMHNYNFHMDKDRMSKAQKQQIMAIQIQSEEPIRPNTEAVDFSSQFTVKKQEEEKVVPKQEKKFYKKKNQQSKAKQLEIVDYKTLPKQPEKEVIELIKDAMQNNYKTFDEFKPFAAGYIKGQYTADVLLRKFLELAGSIQGEILFPILITTVRSQEKQEDLHKEYVKYMQSKSNVTSDGKCNNRFADCSQDASLFKVLIEVVEAELSSRPEGKTKESLYLHPSLLIQMAAIVDKLGVNEMMKFMFIMNFGITHKAKNSITNMIEKANDRTFNESLSVKYEDYFLKDIEPFHLYVIHKYSDMCLAKLQGRPLKEDSKLLNNWEENKSPIKKEEEEEETKTDEKNWASVLVKKNAKAPSNIEKNFPSLAGSGPNREASSWSKSKPGFASNISSGSYPDPVENSFPSLVSAFPSLQSSFPAFEEVKIEKKKQIDPIASGPAIVDNLEFLKGKGFHVSAARKNNKKRGK